MNEREFDFEANEIEPGNYENVLMTLPEDIRNEIVRLEEKAPDSLVAAFVRNCVESGQVEKINELDRKLDAIGEGIGSLGVIEDFDEQERAVVSMETALNPYYSDSERKNALKEIEGLLG